MIPLEKTFKLESEDIITDDLITRIKKKNFSRFPILDKDKIKGFAKTKTLLKMHLNIESKVSSI